MATESAVSQRQGSGDSLDGGSNEPRTEGELAGGHNPPSKEAPRAEPEEDIDILEPQQLESARVGHSPSGETQAIVTELEQDSKDKPPGSEAHEEPEAGSSGEDTLQPRPSLGGQQHASPTEGRVETKVVSSPEGENMTSSSQNCEEKPPTDPTNEESSTEKTRDLSAKTEEVAMATYYPPFVDEADEAQEGSMDSNSVDGSNSRPPESPSTSGQPEPVPPGNQQREPLLQNPPEHAPGEEKQEAEQQVFSQGSPPSVSVATESANQGEAASRASGCVVVVKEKGTGAGGRREGESSQTGGERGQTVSGLSADKTAGQTTWLVRQHEQKIEKHSSKLAPKDSRAVMMESDTYDDSQSDSGVSADFSPCSTMEIHMAADTPPPPLASNETPIEREIRRAVEREHSLRRSRGLQNPPTAPEYVDLPLRKFILTQNLPANCEKSQGKDRQFAGKKMQQEIYTETQREQVLVQLGKIPGIYDKGTVRQLKERKLLFEAFQERKDSSSTLSPWSKSPSWASASDLSTLENQGDDSSTASTLGGSYMESRHSVDLLSQSPMPYSHSAPPGPGVSEGTSCQVIILENSLPAATPFPSEPSTPSNSSASLTKAETLTVVDSGALCAPSSARIEDRGNAQREKEEEEEEELVPKENPFFKLRSSTTLKYKVDKVEQDIREAKERERELRRQRSSLYGGAGAGGGGGGGGEAGGRRTSREMENPSAPPPQNGLVTLDLPATPSRGGAGTSAAHRQPLGKLGIWPPAQCEDQQVIQPESPRTSRQKTPLLQRWEAGLANGNGEEGHD